MIVKINCACNAAFEIKDGAKHPKIIICPNCGRSLPDNASQDLFTALDSFALFESKLEDTGYYEFTVSK